MVGLNPTVENIDTLEHMLVEHLQEGMVVSDMSVPKSQEEDVIPEQIKHLRALMHDINKLYQNPNSSKKDFLETIDKHQKNRDDEVWDKMNQIEMMQGKNLFKVIKKTEKGKKITIQLEKIDDKSRVAMVKQIAVKLVQKMKPEQMTAMIEQGLKNMHNFEELDAFDKKLNEKEEVEVEDGLGCFYVKIDDTKLHIIS